MSADIVETPTREGSTKDLVRAALEQAQANAQAIADLTTAFTEWSAIMTDTFDQLGVEVDKTLADSKTRDQHIADLGTAVDDSHKVAQDAIDRANLDDQQKADLQAQLDAAKTKTQAAVDALKTVELPPAPTTDPGPTPDPTTTPVDPGTGQPVTDPTTTPQPGV